MKGRGNVEFALTVMTHDEIAARLGISVARVNQLAESGLRKLRRAAIRRGLHKDGAR